MHSAPPTLGVIGDACRKVFPTFASVFNSPSAARKLNLDNFCDEFHINVLVATDIDPVWQDPGSWVWLRPNLVANPSLRAVSCGGSFMTPSARTSNRPAPNSPSKLGERRCTVCNRAANVAGGITILNCGRIRWFGASQAIVHIWPRKGD